MPDKVRLAFRPTVIESIGMNIKFIRQKTLFKQNIQSHRFVQVLTNVFFL